MAAAVRRFDDDDDDLYDKAYPGQKVVKDGGRVHVGIMLTDAEPWVRSQYAQLADARVRNAQPHFAVLDAADPAVKAAEQAYAGHNRWLQDAWKTMPSETGGAPKTSAPPADEPGESPCDAYIRRLGSAWKTRPGQADDGDAYDIEAQRQAWMPPVVAGSTPTMLGCTSNISCSGRSRTSPNG
jgi:hypothetical protein